LPVSPVPLLINRRKLRASRRRRSASGRASRAGIGLTALASLGLVVIVALIGLAYTALTADLPSIRLVEHLLDPKDGIFMQPTRLYDRSGEHVLHTLENPGIPRRYLPLDPDQPEFFSPQLVQTTIASQDPGFWRSPGFSFRYLLDEAPHTIAERLADDLLLSGEAPGLRRSLRMRLLAAQMTAVYGRTRVLEWYLNSADYGHLAYGADAAAMLYFGKPATSLTLEEAALLVAVSETPALNPIDAQSAAVERQQVVLERLLYARLISLEDYDRAVRTTLVFADPPQQRSEALASAYAAQVIARLSDRFGARQIQRGGLRIITSLDYDLQVQLACTSLTQLRRLSGGESDVVEVDGQPCTAARLLPTLPPSQMTETADLSTSSAVIDLQTGQVLALLGDTSLDGEGGLLLGHQPGSMLTPFIAMTAFARGMSPASLVWDIPPSTGEEGITLQVVDIDRLPANRDGKYHGPQRLRMAIANDFLSPVETLLQQVGPATVYALSEPLGLALYPDPARPGALLYEGGSINPLEMGQAYSVFARLGSQPGENIQGSLAVQPVLALRVEDDIRGTWYQWQESQPRSLVSPQVAYLVHSVLSDETARWLTLGYPNPLEIGRPVGAKVGASAGEAWSAGYTPQRMLVVWMGDRAGSTRALDPLYPAGVWHAMMQYMHTGLPVQDWTRPDGISTVVVCDPSGKLPTVDCPTTVEEVFLSGSEPVEYDNLYRTVQINRETRLLATVFTPLELIDEETFMIPPREALEWARATGVDLPPDGYDVIQAPAMQPGVRIQDPAIFSSVSGVVEIRGDAAGESFSSYRIQVGQGLNPRTWLQVGQDSAQPITGGLLAQWDTTTLEDGLYAVRLTVVRKDATLQTAILQVTVDNTPPDVQVLYPADGQAVSLSEAGSISLIAEVSDLLGVESVVWKIDGRQVEEQRQAPFVFNWEGRTGKHTLQVQACDRAGNCIDTAPIEFVVQN